MKLTTMFSKSGKTKYFGIEFKTGEAVKVQSRTKALDIIKFVSPEAKLELVKDVKGHRFRLHIDNIDCGNISKTAFKQLVNLTKGNNYGNSSSNSNSQSIQQSQLSLSCNSSEVSEVEREVNVEVLPSSPQRLCSDRNERGNAGSILAVMERVQNEGNFIQRLEEIDRDLSQREASECEFTRRLAGIRRGQLEIAFEQREITERQQAIREGQQAIREGQRAIRDGQRAIREEQCFIKDGIESIARAFEKRGTNVDHILETLAQIEI